MISMLLFLKVFHINVLFISLHFRPWNIIFYDTIVSSANLNLLWNYFPNIPTFVMLQFTSISWCLWVLLVIIYDILWKISPHVLDHFIFKYYILQAWKTSLGFNTNEIQVLQIKSHTIQSFFIHKLDQKISKILLLN
jgi:hypothetical protein